MIPNDSIAILVLHLTTINETNHLKVNMSTNQMGRGRTMGKGEREILGKGGVIESMFYFELHNISSTKNVFHFRFSFWNVTVECAT